MEDLRFHIVDYVVMALFLVISSIIGVYYGFFKKQSTTEDYLLGGRQMHLFPVALSLLVTYQSAISVLGVPVEVYLYNIMMFYMYIAIGIANFMQATLIVPLMYPLRLTSTYEYLGLRFRSRSVQLLGTVIGMLQTLLYMSVVLLAPALALEAVAGVPLWLSIIIIGFIGTVYTSIGGMRTVIWTDVFQFIVLYGGLTVILVMGGLKIGSFTKIFELAYAGKRTAFNEISVDPRVRHTVWGLLIGGIFQWLPNCCNQSAVQRICSMKSARDAKISTYLSIPLMLIYGLILSMTGLLLYAYFVNEECGPIAAGKIGNANQLMPYFVMHVLNDVPGLGGIFIAALFSGALSSLSSGINAMAANTLQDILVNCLENITQKRKTLFAQLIVFVYGTLAVVMAYMARNLSGPVTQMALSAFGSAGGPVVGIFFLGAMFPQANWIGAFTGGIVSIAINMWIAMGSFIYGYPAEKSPAVPTTGCFTNSSNHMNGTSYMYGNIQNATHFFVSESPVLTTTDVSVPTVSGHLVIYDMSYTYFGLLGFLLTMIIGLTVSLLTGKEKHHKVEADYIFPCLRDFWKLEYKPVSPTVPGSYTFEFKENGDMKEVTEIPEQILKSMEITVKT
ncbi:sodium-coupled monocarboxylate transporter 2-like [Mercenaria mercenaria]|uniref:sodium-coupled monocarboxylate transporter 2-like n=1 Tax=Mercenaria mercenaria TaxID=6596 RepID=UPI00234F6076|nr:sodium-coupled monocarboxylate transporter 2-like [Mercenaria mercenaria]